MTALVPLEDLALVAVVGAGAMGEVWRARHRDHDHDVAVKVMTGDAARDPEGRAAFRREVAAVAALDHPAIVRVLDHGEVPPASHAASSGRLAAGSPYLVMELATSTLADALPVTSWEAARRVLERLLAALGHAHARGIVHRDLKPSNVLVVGHATKLADFGVALDRRGGTESAGSPRVVGSPPYMAPEQLRGDLRDMGPWTDLYALGCLAWTLVAGRPPFVGSTTGELARQHLYDLPPQLEPAFDVPAGLTGWLELLLAKDRHQRFDRAADAAEALAQVAATGATAPGRGSDAEPSAWADETLLDDALAADHGVDPAAHAPTAPPAERRGRAPIPETWRARAEDPIGAAPGAGLFAVRAFPFVGRHDVRDALWTALRDVARAPGPRAVVLRGAAGVGKSHLALWLCHRAHEVGAATWLRARHGLDPAPHAGVTGMVIDHLRCRDLIAADVSGRVRRELEAYGVVAETQLRELVGLVTADRDVLDDHGATLVGERHRFAIIARYLARVASRRLVLVWLDDVQWGADSLRCARFVLRASEAARTPVLFVLTVRDEALDGRPAERDALASLLREPRADARTVGPLDDSDHRDLVDGLLALEPALAVRVRARTAGNPLFAVQLVGDWVTRGVLRPRAGRFVLAPGEVAPVPDSVHAVWSDRLRAVLAHAGAGSQATALEVGALLGPEVSAQEWRAACAAGAVVQPDAIVETAHRHGLVEWVRREGDDEGWSFVHPMLRESVERLAREAGRSAAHHRWIAEALAADASAGVSSAVERRGLHLLAAGDGHAAIGPLSEAASGRLRRGELAQAAELARRWEEAIDAAEADASEAERAHHLAWTAQIQHDLGQMTAAEAAAELALEHLGPDRRGGDAARSTWVLGNVALWRGQLDLALELVGDARAMADRSGALELVIACRHTGGTILVYLGRFDEAIDAIGRGLGEAEAAGEEALAVSMLRRLAHAQLAADRPDAAAATVSSALARARVLANPIATGELLLQRAEIDRARGNLDAAASGYRRALTELERGGRGDDPLPHVNLGLVLVARGEHAGARRELDRARSEWQRAGATGRAAAAAVFSLPSLGALGEWEQWDACVADATRHLLDPPVVDPDLGWAAEEAGRIARVAGERARARVAYGLALGQWTGMGRGPDAARVRASLEELATE